MTAIRFTKFKLGLMAATLSVALLPSAGQAYTPEQQQACMGDAMSLCSSEVPDVDKVTICMIRKKSQLSPGCRMYFRGGAAEDALLTGKTSVAKPATVRKPKAKKPLSPDDT